MPQEQDFVFSFFIAIFVSQIYSAVDISKDYKKALQYEVSVANIKFKTYNAFTQHLSFLLFISSSLYRTASFEC